MGEAAESALALRLGDPRLFPPERLRVVVDELIPVSPDDNLLGMELIYREWLTPFQWRKLADGRGDDLFIGPYTLLESLGEGGMGRVYRVWNRKCDRIEALKLLREDGRANGSLRRFQREIGYLGQLRHPNIAPALDAGFIRNRWYYTMDYVVGEDLARRVRHDGPIHPSLAAYYIAQAALGLQYAHDKGLIHRDVKPSNLLLVDEGQQVRLLDLGLARWEGGQEAGQTVLTSHGSLIGSPDYMSPEQIADSHDVDPRTDIYSLGCTLYHLVAGRPPFGDLSVGEKLVAHTYRSAVPLAELLPDTPAWLDELTREMMAKLPCHRPARPLDIYHRLAPHVERELFSTPISGDTHHGKAQTTARMDAIRVDAIDPHPTARFSARRVDSQRVMHLRPADEPPATPTLVMSRANIDLSAPPRTPDPVPTRSRLWRCVFEAVVAALLAVAILAIFRVPIFGLAAPPGSEESSLGHEASSPQPCCGL